MSAPNFFTNSNGKNFYDLGNSVTLGVKEATQTAILSVVATAKAIISAAGTPVTVYLPDGGSTGIALTSPLPLVSGLRYVGVFPTFTHSSSVPDNDVTFTGGTWFTCTSTKCFQAQDLNGNALDTDKGSADANFSTTGIKECGVYNVGIQGATTGISIGAVNQCGALYSEFRNIVINGCTVWGINAQNFQHTEFTRIWTFGCVYGQRYAASVASATLQPGNSKVSQLFDNPTSALSTANKRLHRGIVFEATDGSNLNEIMGDRLQVNNFAKSTTTYTAASGGTSQFTLATGKGAEMQVGMPIKFTNAGGNGNITTGLTYFIKSISTDTVTVSATRNGSAITGSFSASTAFTTYGFGNMEFIGGSSGSVTNSVFQNLDLEGICQSAISLENCTGCTFLVNELFTNPGTEQHLVIRTSQPNQFQFLNSYTSDIDGSSTQNYLVGTRDITNSKQNTAQWVGRNASSSRFTIGIGSADVSVRGGNIEQKEPSGGQFLYPLSSIGQRVHGNFGGSGSINAGQSGWIGLTGSGTVTINLPAIDAATVGMCFEITNFRTGIATITVNGTQYYDNQSAHTSITLPAVSGATVAKCVIRAVDDGSSGNYHWSVLTLYGGAAIV